MVLSLLAVAVLLTLVASIRGLKSIGYVEVTRLPPRRTSSSSARAPKSSQPSPTTPASRQWTALAITAVVLVGAFFFPLLTNSIPSPK